MRLPQLLRQLYPLSAFLFNLTASRDSYANSINIPPQGDVFDSIRAEYTEMLQNQLAKGNNGPYQNQVSDFRD